MTLSLSVFIIQIVIPKIETLQKNKLQWMLTLFLQKISSGVFIYKLKNVYDLSAIFIAVI